MQIFKRSLLLHVTLVFALLAAPAPSYADQGSDKMKNPETDTKVLRKAWESYHARSEKMRVLIESTPRFKNTPEHRSMAYKSLLEAQAMAYSIAVAPQTEFPVIHSRLWYANFYTLGGTSPDFYYGALFLDGDKTYKITGNFGDYRLIVAQVFSHLMGHPKSTMLGNFEFSDFDIHEDGSFEVIASSKKRGGNWIPLDPESKYNFIFIRRAMSDWYDGRGSMKVTLLDEPERYEEPDDKLQAERILLAADFMEFLVKRWNIGVYDMYLSYTDGQKNTLAMVPGSEISKDVMGSPSTFYFWGVYEIKNDEALIIEMDAPDAGYWSFQLFDVWTKPLDFVNRQTDVNMSRAAIDDDGKLRIVISSNDPGVANWLDTAGRKEGTMVGRNYLANAIPDKAPKAKLVKFSEVLDYLPSDTKMVSPEERQKALEYRRKGYLKMYNEIP